MKEKLSYLVMSLYFDRELREITLLTFDIVSGTILPVVRNESEGRTQKTMECRKNLVEELRKGSADYRVIADRTEELKERVRHLLVPDYYEELDKLLECIEVQHELELKAVYRSKVNSIEQIEKGADV